MKRWCFVVLVAGLVAASTPAVSADGGEQELGSGQIAYEIPVPDPRYDHDRSLPFETPEELANGALPGDHEELVDFYVRQRIAMGLPGDRLLTAELVRAPGAIDQVREYGVVLDAAEEAAFLHARAVEDAAILLVEQLHDRTWFAGVRIDWAGVPAFSEPSVALLSTHSGLAEAEEATEELGGDGGRVSVEEVESSLAELRQAAEAIRSAVRSNGRAGDREQLGDEIAELATDPEVVAVGWSLRNNQVVVDLRPGSASRASLSLEGLPRFAFTVGETVMADHGKDPCNRFGCAPQRAGIEIERRWSDSWCSLGFAVESSSGGRDWLTAGHCLGTGPDAQFAAGSGGGSWTYSAFFNMTRDVYIGAYGSSGHYDQSRLDGQTIEESNFLVTNRLRTGLNSATTVTGTLAYGTSMIGESICRTGANSDVAACGTVVDVGEDATDDQTQVEFIEQIRGSVAVAGSEGDSGGPVYRQTAPWVAVGVYKGDYDSNGEAVIGSVQHLADVESGLSVYTTTDRARDFVLGMYEHGLGRFADLNGYNHWRNKLDLCTVPRAAEVASGILTSSEFRGRYPINTYDRRKIRVELAYWTMMGRPSDSGGLTSWANQLTSEAAWTTVVNSFTGSTEFANRVTSGASAYDGRVC